MMYLECALLLFKLNGKSGVKQSTSYQKVPLDLTTEIISWHNRSKKGIPPCCNSRLTIELKIKAVNSLQKVLFDLPTEIISWHNRFDSLRRVFRLVAIPVPTRWFPFVILWRLPCIRRLHAVLVRPFVLACFSKPRDSDEWVVKIRVCQLIFLQIPSMSDKIIQSFYTCQHFLFFVSTYSFLSLNINLCFYE